jgi:replicative DNA helicase
VTEPHDLDAEMTVLSAMTMSPRAVEQVEEVIGPVGEAFYRDTHQLIYRAMLALYAAGKPTDIITVSDFLEEKGMLAGVGGRGKLAEISVFASAAGNAAHYALIVVTQARLRDLIAVGKEIVRIGEERAGEIGDLIDQAEQLALGLRDRYDGHKQTVKTAFELAEWLDARTKNPMDPNEGVASPFSFLPRLLEERLYVLAGYSADGKTAVGTEFLKVGSVPGPAGFASLEMGWRDVAVRMGANAGASAKQLETGHIREQDRAATAAAIGRVATMNVKVLDDPFATIGSIHRFQRLGRYKLLVVDHLHQFQLRETQYERQELEKILHGLNGIARELKVPVILLSQLSRTGDPKKPYPRPTMASLKGTGAIEQLAWCVWFIWRQRDEKNLPKMESEFIVAKNRSGRTGAWPMMFHDRQVRYTETRPEVG